MGGCDWCCCGRWFSLYDLIWFHGLLTLSEIGGFGKENNVGAQFCLTIFFRYEYFGRSFGWGSTRHTLLCDVRFLLFCLLIFSWNLSYHRMRNKNNFCNKPSFVLGKKITEWREAHFWPVCLGWWGVHCCCSGCFGSLGWYEILVYNNSIYLYFS